MSAWVCVTEEKGKRQGQSGAGSRWLLTIRGECQVLLALLSPSRLAPSASCPLPAGECHLQSRLGQSSLPGPLPPGPSAPNKFQTLPPAQLGLELWDAFGDRLLQGGMGGRGNSVAPEDEPLGDVLHRGSRVYFTWVRTVFHLGKGCISPE